MPPAVSALIFERELERWLLSVGKINPARDLREGFDLVMPRGHLEC